MNAILKPTPIPLRGLLDNLGTFAHSFQLSDAPEVVQRQSKLSILDTVGCMVSGLSSDEGKTFLALESLGRAIGEASSVGGSERLSVQAAARINAYLGDVFELNDLTGGHASIAIVPTALAVAESQSASGKALVEAVAVGIEVTSRVYAAYYDTMKSYEETGIAPPGIPSTIGATAAAARLAGLDVQQTCDALSIATALAGWCPAEVIFGQGGTIKPMLFGAWPASVAIQAIGYAKAGFNGPSRVLESRIGLYATLARSFDESPITRSQTWYLAQPRRKQHACCGYIHSAIDATIALRKAGNDVEGASSLEIHMPQYIIPGVSKTQPPTASNEARFHAQYCIALAAVGEDVIQPEHSIEFEKHFSRVESLMRKIRVVENGDLKHYHQCKVVGLDQAGAQLFELSLNAPKGAPGDPMSDDEVRNKFRALCGRVLAADALDTYIARINELDKQPGCEWVVREFSESTKD